MSATVHVASHPDALVARLCDQLAAPPDDPFTSELVAVPTRGIERWLTERVASELEARGIGDGICANVDFPSPRRLVRDVMAEVPGLAESVTVWEGPDLVAHVIASIDATVGEPWMRLLARFLESDDGTSAKRLAAADKVARLFTRYARRRPDMIRAWAGGTDVGPDGAALPEGDAWQPRLWRTLRESVGRPALPELLPDALEPIRTGAVSLDLPDRLVVHGLTATDPLDLDVLLALGVQRDVHLHVLHPSPALWQTTATHLETETPRSPVPDRAEDPTEGLVTHPLLRVWARDSRELQMVLASRGLAASLTGASDNDESQNLLRRLQADIGQNRSPNRDAALAAAVEAGGDRSVQVHACHGDRRQAEVLRDAILHVLAADPTLEPRDVVIMTPDLDTFAPLLEAAFPADGTGDEGLPDLRLRIADRSPYATNPLVRFTANLLATADARFEAAIARELISASVVQQRFGFDLETAGELIALIDDATIAWGLDAAERESWGAGENDERTWTRGLDRVLSGVFFADDATRVVEATVPMGGVEGQDADAAGLLAHLVDRLVAARGLLAETRPISTWPHAISSAVRLLAAPAWGDDWQWDQLERLLTETFSTPEAAADDSVDPVIGLAEARLAASAWTDDRPSPLHFRTGDITVCTLAPMRSVPYRVVCLLGMDDDRFPRRGRSDGDDLLLRHELVGDHDRSSEDRQLLLDAVMAAGDHLLVTYSGRDELTNADLPPAVPISELLDTVAEMVGPGASRRVITSHPLQAFSDDNYTAGRLGVDGPWAFDGRYFDAAREKRSGPRLPPEAEWPSWEAPDTVRLDRLVAFLEHPAEEFVRARLGFTVPKPVDEPDDHLGADLDGLAQWSLKDRLLAGLADGHDLDDLTARERASDALPPGDLGTDDLEGAMKAVRTLWSEAVEQGYDPAATAPVEGLIELGERRLEGSVLANRARAHVATLTPSRLKAKHRLRAYTQLLFVSAIEPTTPWTAVLIGKRPDGDNHVVITLGPVGADPDARRQIAEQALAELLELYDLGMRHPVPMPCETAYAWQRGMATDRRTAFRDAAKKWESDRYSPESADPVHQLLFPHLGSTSELVDEGLDGLAARLWGPILPLCREVTL